MTTDPKPTCLNLALWRAATRDEVAAWVRRDRKAGASQGDMIVVRSHLKPVDIYCYLRARFGEPNGFQNFLRRDDSDNWIHWDYNVKAGDVDVYFAGSSREIHIMTGERLTDQQWRNLIVNLKMDYARIGADKSAVLKTLEKYVVFQNKFVSIAELCAELHAAILDAPRNQAFPSRAPKEKSRLESFEDEMKINSRRATELGGNCLKLRLLMPIMAEAFINIVILMFTRDAIRNDNVAYQDFVRAKIPDRLALLNRNCYGFDRAIDEGTEVYAAFMRVIDKRNFAIHGNVDPMREQIEVVYFDGKRPLFNAPGNHVGKFFEHLEAIYRPDEILADYEAVHAFLYEIESCLNARTRLFFDQVINDAYPGYEVHKKRVTRILPDHIVTGMLAETRYDDDLEVEW